MTNVLDSFVCICIYYYYSFYFLKWNQKWRLINEHKRSYIHAVMLVPWEIIRVQQPSKLLSSSAWKVGTKIRLPHRQIRLPSKFDKICIQKIKLEQWLLYHVDKIWFLFISEYIYLPMLESTLSDFWYDHLITTWSINTTEWCNTKPSLPYHKFSFYYFQCAKSTMQNKIISSDKDLIGIVFFGTVSMRKMLKSCDKYHSK